ncbi:MAG TPA: hypothetical protein VLY21_03745 [Nitrososphaerales archaeon]|nr:hypothetical protein [Nitrososphaerales archaeon]
MATTKQGVPLTIPQDVWQHLMEVRAQLDSFCPGKPTPVEEALREVVHHYKHCPKTLDEMDEFCAKAKAWK